MNIRYVILCAMLQWLWASPMMALGLQAIRNSIFKIEVVSQEPNFHRPWMQKTASVSTGTGFYIGENRILTNAHVVANGKFITVQRDGDDNPEEVRVLFIAHDCDLAIIEPKRSSYLKNAKPLALGGLPRLLKPVTTIGYPRGGDQLSTTDGVVSRISYRTYAHIGDHDHLLVQVDSAINPGNSGGPVLQGSRVVGVAFQTFTAAENTGYIIPTPVIYRFLKDIEDGEYDGHPDDGLTVMESAMESQATRRFDGILHQVSGVKVASVDQYSPLFGKIKPGDVLLKISDQVIGVDGKVNFQFERVDFKVLYDLRQVGDRVEFELMRDGKLLKVPVKVEAAKPHYTQSDLYPDYPRYVMFAGFVFTPLSRDYLKYYGRKWSRQSPLPLRYFHWNAHTAPEFRDVEDIVVLSQRLQHPINTYFDNYEDKILTKVNDQPIKSLEDLDDVLEKAKGEYVVFEFFGHVVPIVLPLEQARRVHGDIAKQYGVSPDKWLETSDGATGGQL